MTDYQGEITRAVAEVARRYDERLGELLAAMPVGATLCVHHEPAAGDFALDRDAYTWTVRAKAHVLTGGATCDVPVRREQYGPKTPEMAALIEARMAGR